MMSENRRAFLRAAGVSLALPWLADWTSSRRARGADDGTSGPRRLVCICTPLGLHAPNLIPKDAGAEYTSTPYLDLLADHRRDLTVISGLAHPGVESGHDSIYSFLTGAMHPERRAGFRNSISLDQWAAERIGVETRFPSLALSAEGFSLSWTRSGALVPSEFSPARVFARLFLDGRPDEVALQIQRLQDGQSILDQVGGQARSVQNKASREDREKLEEYFSSVRELEQRMARAEEWSRRPKPKVAAKPPQDIANPADLIGRTRLLFDLTHLALETDSTRLVTIMLLGTSLTPPIPGVSDGHHNLSHHGQDPGKLAQLKTVEEEKLKVFRELLDKLSRTREGAERLLDRTAVFFGSNLGNASSHSCRNLPVLLAGGRFRHGSHLAFDEKSPPPLCNLYVSLLHHLGLDAEHFGSSTGALPQLAARH
ncbi:MAG: DUF1552 domain-containing protein [Pirellulales bacterium]